MDDLLCKMSLFSLLYLYLLRLDFSLPRWSGERARYLACGAIVPLQNAIRACCM